jgi:hypothetical protein
LLWNPVRCSDAAPPALQDPPAARPSGLPVMYRVAAPSWSARVPCFPCASRASSVCSHTASVCVCLPPCLTYRSPVFRLPVCGWRRLPVWRQRGSGGSRRHPCTLRLVRSRAFVLGGVCVCSPPWAACSFPCCAGYACRFASGLAASQGGVRAVRYCSKFLPTLVR